MNWWGKLLGGAFGFVLGGPVGALLGAALGHTFDKSLAHFETQAQTDGAWLDHGTDGDESNEPRQAAFFTATFAIMGYIAKADGRVSEAEIAQARSVMGFMQLDANQIGVAIGLFNQGKQTDFPYAELLDQLKLAARNSRSLLQLFVEIQIGMALADGELHDREQQILRDVATRLGFGVKAFEAILVRVVAQRGFAVHQPPPKDALQCAYEVLGVARSASDAEIKNAYRRLMNQHHPDKLVAKGLPEEMMQVATEKTREIKAAYDLIKKTRQALA